MSDAQQSTVKAIKAHFGEPEQQFGDYTEADNLYYGRASVAVYPDGSARVYMPRGNSIDQHRAIGILYILLGRNAD